MGYLELFPLVLLSILFSVESTNRFRFSPPIGSQPATVEAKCSAGSVASNDFTMSYDFQCVSCGQTCCNKRTRRRLARDSGRRLNPVRGQFPWSVAIFKNTGTGWKYICGGALLSGDVIGTAAHCIEHENVQNLRVTVGEVDIEIDSNGTRQRKLYELKRVHRAYLEHTDQRPYAEDVWVRPNIRRRDFALLFLEQEVTNQRICLRRRSMRQTDPVCFGIGHGLNKRGRISSRLQWTKVELDFDNKCLRGKLDTSDATMLCASNGAGRAVGCRIASGNPVLCRLEKDDSCSSYYLAGIISFGHRPTAEGCEGNFTVLADLTSTGNSALVHIAATAASHDDIQESYMFEPDEALCSSMTRNY